MSDPAEIIAGLPGTGEAPNCPIFIDGRHATTLRGTYEELAAEFQRLVDEYIETRFTDRALPFEDPHGMRLALVESGRTVPRPFTPWPGSPVAVAQVSADRAGAFALSVGAESPTVCSRLSRSYQIS